MPKGVKPKQDHIKVGEKAVGVNRFNANPGDDDLSPVDQGKDFVKTGER